MSKFSPLEFYNCTRDQIKHEDNLVDCRIKWLLQINGFLFAAFALPYIVRPEIACRATTFRVILCLLGFGTSYYAIIIINEANRSLMRLERDWFSFCSMNSLNANDYPQISGAKPKECSHHKKRIPNLIPIMLTVAWALMLLLINS